MMMMAWFGHSTSQILSELSVVASASMCLLSLGVRWTPRVGELRPFTGAILFYAPSLAWTKMICDFYSVSCPWVLSSFSSGALGYDSKAN